MTFVVHFDIAILKLSFFKVYKAYHLLYYRIVKFDQILMRQTIDKHKLKIKFHYNMNTAAHLINIVSLL